MISQGNQDSLRPANLKPEVVGGHNLTAIRALFDLDDKNLILVSDRQLFYYCIKTSDEVGRAGIEPSKLSNDERIVSCERLDSYLYLITNYGLIFIWSLELRDWINELYLPIKDEELVVSCKLLSKRQYVFTLHDRNLQQTTINYSMSRSERERPKQRETISECLGGEQHMFDVGCIHSSDETDESPKKASAKSKKDNFIVYIKKNGLLCLIKVLATGKLSDKTARLPIRGSEFTCVRANTTRSLIAAGDDRGRIFIYSGDYVSFRFESTKLHWHTLPVNDLCFSNTGNTLFSSGGESGCVVVWELTANNLGQKRVFARLGMPIRLINCSNILNQLVLSTEDNEIIFLNTNGETSSLKTLTRRTIDMYLKNDFKALRQVQSESGSEVKSVGLLGHSQTDTVITNCRTGWLQFYSPRLGARLESINLLRTSILSLESKAKVVPSEITKAALSSDGQWLALYETWDSGDLFPVVKLHIWQKSFTSNKFSWIQTADRLHESTSIADLRFSPDGRFLISVGGDGSFHMLHRICLEPKTSSNSKSSKQLYARGFVGNVPEKYASMAAFPRDSSVLAISLLNDTTLIWQIVDPYKLVYECQLSKVESDVNFGDQSSPKIQRENRVLGLHFGQHKPIEIVAPLCEVRQDSIRIWNILNSDESLEYLPVSGSNGNSDDSQEFTSAAFDECAMDTGDYSNLFAVSNKKNEVFIFKLELSQNALQPLVIIDANPTYCNPDIPLRYEHMCFLSKPILEVDRQCLPNENLVDIISRLCLMNNYQELVGITDKLTLERKSAINSCNAIKTLEQTDLNSYFIKKELTYQEEKNSLPQTDKTDLNKMTEKQRRIRNRGEVQKMLRDLIIRIPSQNLPPMEILGPMMLDKLM